MNNELLLSKFSSSQLKTSSYVQFFLIIATCFKTVQNIFITNIINVSFVYRENINIISPLRSHVYQIKFIFQGTQETFLRLNSLHANCK